MITKTLPNKELITCLCRPSCMTSNNSFDALYLEQHIRGRSVLGDLLQTGVHKIAEVIRPENDKIVTIKEACVMQQRFMN